jgi:hypothetical protein
MNATRTVYTVHHQIRKLQKLAANDSSCSDKGAAGSKKKPALKRNKADGKQRGNAGGGQRQGESGVSAEGGEESPTKKQKVKPEPEDHDDENVQGLFDEGRDHNILSPWRARRTVIELDELDDASFEKSSQELTTRHEKRPNTILHISGELIFEQWNAYLQHSSSIPNDPHPHHSPT